MSTEAKEISQARAEGKQDGLARAQRLTNKHARLLREFAQDTGTRLYLANGVQVCPRCRREDV